MTPEIVAYLAGFLEGEGCFCIRKFKKHPDYRYPEIIVGSTDMDVLVNAREMSGGLGKVYSRKVPTNPKHKQCHIWGITKTAEAHQLMELVLPFMGERRSEKIREVLQATRKE